MKRIAPLAIVTCALALSFTLAAPAEAGGRHGRHDRQRHHDRHRVEDRHRQHDRHRQYDRHRDRDRYRQHDRYERRHDRRHQRFDIPGRIHRRHAGDFGRYYDRHVYFAPHRHRHSTYRFPVVIDGYRTFRRYDYCEGELFRPHGSVGYEGRRWGVRLDF